MVYTKKDDKLYKEKLQKHIANLKKEKNAIIISHNYQREEIQEIADIHGDSLALSQAVVKTDADVIVFCGVHFMAESASILNPEKTILLPVKEAGCPLADMVNLEKLRSKKLEYPDAAVVCYVNTDAAIKAESDICCTSSNAVEIVRSLKDYRRVIFVPDKNLGMYVQSLVPDKQIILWEGFCPTHIGLSGQDVKEAKAKHPKAKFIAHPECNLEVLNLADYISSTGGMFKYVRQSEAKEFIIGTECGIVYRLQIENPDKKFFMPSERLICPNMKLTTLGWVVRSLELGVYEVRVSDEIRKRSKKVLDRMLAVTGEKSGVAYSGV